MRQVEVPGGTAFFREPEKDAMPGRAVKLIKAAALSAGSQLSDYPEIFEPPKTVKDETTGEERAETDRERTARLSPRLDSLRLSVEQAMAFDTLREATVVGTLDHWTLGQKLPTFETIGDLPNDLYEALLEAVGGVSAAQLEEDFERTGDPSDEVPTGSSGLSESPSKDVPELTSTPTSSTATSPSDGDDFSPAQ